MCWEEGGGSGPGGTGERGSGPGSGEGEAQARGHRHQARPEPRAPISWGKRLCVLRGPGGMSVAALGLPVFWVVSEVTGISTQKETSGHVQVMIMGLFLKGSVYPGCVCDCRWQQREQLRSLHLNSLRNGAAVARAITQHRL